MIHVPSRKTLFLQIALVFFAGLLDRSWAQDGSAATALDVAQNSALQFLFPSHTISTGDINLVTAHSSKQIATPELRRDGTQTRE